jgi:hypothetical protein
MLGSPNPSPAWMVKWKFSWAMRLKASRWRVGDVEPDDPRVAVPHRQLRDLDRLRGLPHGRDDQADRDRASLRPAPEAVEHGQHGFIERQAALGQQLGRHAHLGVHDAVGRQVLGTFGAHALDRVARLHDRDRVAEALEVELERLAIGSRGEPARQLVRIRRRQLAIADLGRELQHGPRAQPAVEVVMEEDLRRAAAR